jgi:hypothetical protein
MVAEMARRVVADGRPAVVLYFVDFDPAGRQMAVSVSRKLQALRDLYYPELEIAVYPVALNLEQVREYGLPSSPLKDSERRGDRWRERMGHEQTEIDAMIALYPDELTEIARIAIQPFYDPTLAGRCLQAESQWQEEADAIYRAHPAYPDALRRVQIALDALRNSSRGSAQDAVAAFEAIQEEVGQDLARNIELPAVVLPEPNYDPSRAPEPLFSTSDDYVTATRKLVNHKSLDEE